MQNSVIDKELLCQQYLHLLYQDKKGHREQSTSQRVISESYGEILYPGVNKLLSLLALTNEDYFVDVGSGLGKLAMQVFLNSAVKKVYGIELIPELHQQALLALQRLKHDLPEFYKEGRDLQFILGNFLEVPLPTATVMLIGSPCFSPNMLDSLARVIESTTSIHTVLTLRPLCNLQRLSCKSMCRIEGSWDTALCYIYSA